jgi:hypothetical protein
MSKMDDKALARLRAAGAALVQTHQWLTEVWDDFEAALFAAPGSTWADSGVDYDLLGAIQECVGAKTTAERVRAESIRSVIKSEGGERETSLIAKLCSAVASSMPSWATGPR